MAFTAFPIRDSKFRILTSSVEDDKETLDVLQIQTEPNVMWSVDFGPYHVQFYCPENWVNDQVARLYHGYMSYYGEYLPFRNLQRVS